MKIRINNRKLLAALAESCGGADKMTDITIAIDKLDKIGLAKVKEELRERGLDQRQIAIVEKYLSIGASGFNSGSATPNISNEARLAQAGILFAGNETAAKGIAELQWVLNYGQLTSSTIEAPLTNPSGAQLFQHSVPRSRPLQLIHHRPPLSIDLTLARGLNYYTGIIFEVQGPQRSRPHSHSIGGGGRYDDLTGLFGVPNIPGVGISFGVDRIYDVMEELNLFPDRHPIPAPGSYSSISGPGKAARGLHPHATTACPRDLLRTLPRTGKIRQTIQIR